MPKFYMMVGVPGSGKSTWIKNYNQNALVASSDAYIDMVAKNQDSTYSQVFDANIKAANNYALGIARQAFDFKLDLIWDQTNLTAKSRKEKLKLVPDSYEKIAVVFPIPDEKELARRLANRPGKTIPDNVMKSMIANFTPPTTDEGFDRIINV